MSNKISMFKATSVNAAELILRKKPTNLVFKKDQVIDEIKEEKSLNYTSSDCSVESNVKSPVIMI